MVAPEWFNRSGLGSLVQCVGSFRIIGFDGVIRIFSDWSGFYVSGIFMWYWIEMMKVVGFGLSRMFLVFVGMALFFIEGFSKKTDFRFFSKVFFFAL